jgi:hypothetical protein
MKIIKNDIEVEVPLGLPVTGGIKDGYQVFLQKDARQIEKHVEALTYMTAWFKPQWTEVLHPFAGLGVTAQVLDQKFKNLNHTMWERDQTCVQYVRDNTLYAIKLVQDSYVKLMQEDLIGYHAIMFDPTAGTIKTPGMTGLWHLFADAKIQLVWVTDSACSKIWLHRDHYRPELGRIVLDAEDYLQAYNDMLNKLGYTIVAAWKERDATYFVALWGRHHPSFTNIIRL